MKLYLDPGHGGSDPGAQGNGLSEKNITLDIAQRIRSILIGDYRSVDVRMSRTSDSSKSLQQRTNEANAWGADYFLSIHCNAFNGNARGYEDFIHNTLSDSSQTARYRNVLHTEIMKVNQLSNRGKKKANFHVLRESNMSALLTENGFIDNQRDAALMRTASWRQRVAQGHVNGLAKAFNLKRKEEDNDNGSGQLYKVIAGSFKSKANAEQRIEALNKKGISCYLDSLMISGELWFRVQAGAFSNRTNAESQLTRVRNAGIRDAYIISD
ncbi:N-acetylmuramoyl-L-alanine amidase [Oceanobacillus manasiensis]|uniref:N-acetylmuramoyl-L-alanine amidase n=1 Tax=Oceanobacillus manasiensis TaxID=586413 RepID=UPI0005AAB304|nr:N-acetylmuramoyl-L-alanine amidase [Oceanobacillus manasiensis]